MGCHSWAYKKVSSFTKDELNELLTVQIKSQLKGYAYTSSQEDFASRQLETALRTLSRVKNGHDVEDWEIKYAHSHDTYHKCSKEWAKYQKKKKEMLLALEEFKSNPNATSDEFIKIYKKFVSDFCT